MTRMLAVLSAALQVGSTSPPAWACGEKNVSAAGPSIVVAQASAKTSQEGRQGEAQTPPGQSSDTLGRAPAILRKLSSARCAFYQASFPASI